MAGACIAKPPVSFTAPRHAPAERTRSRLVVRAASQNGGTVKRTARVKVVPIGDVGTLRDKAPETKSIKLLSRIQQLRLLTKVEKSGLLTTIENLGFTLTSIEKLGLLSKAEELGVLSAATDPSTPGSLFSTALALLLVGPVFVYFVPEDSVPLIVAQFVVAGLSVLGGSAAFAASNFVASLQAATS